MRTMRCALSLLLIATLPAAAAPVALRGGTIVDLRDFGRSTNDIANAVVVLDGDRIVAAGAASEVEVPDGATIVDATGKYFVPGLVDAFSVQNNEAQARAHLYMGVTTVFVNDHDPRRGASMEFEGGPAVVTLALAAGYDFSSAPGARTIAELRARGRALSATEVASAVDAARWQGMGGLLVYYSMAPEQVSAAVQRAKSQRMVAVGEVGHTGVLDAAQRGVPLFVHANRSLLDVAPREVRKAVADDPFGEGRTAFMSHLLAMDPDSPRLRTFGERFAKQRAAIMPTLASYALTLPGHANPWREPVAAILDPRDIMLPADRDTGVAPHPWPPEQALHLLALHRRLASLDVKYVVGSGSDAFGQLPGLGAHQEMELLVRIGLTPRESLAAATANLPELVDFVDYGAIRPGARADILVLDADPTRDIGNARRIARLYLRGREVDRAALLTTPLETDL